MFANSRAVSSNQSGVHVDLEKVVRRHLASAWQPMGSITVTQSGSRQSIGGYQNQQQSMTLPLEVMVEKE